MLETMKKEVIQLEPALGSYRTRTNYKSNYLPNGWSGVSTPCRNYATGHIKDIITFLAELFEKGYKSVLILALRS